MRTHKDLEVWKVSIDFVTAIYRATQSFPKEEIYGLTSQIRRCVVSIPSNIAEGAVKNSDKDFARFLSIALGSSSELDTQLIIAKKLEFIDETTFKELTIQNDSIGKMLNGLIRYLRNKN